MVSAKQPMAGGGREQRAIAIRKSAANSDGNLSKKPQFDPSIASHHTQFNC
jgi:hypothetical protein